MSKQRNFSKERKELQKQGLCPNWMTTMGWQLFSQKYLNGDCKNPKEQYQRIAKTLAEHAPKEYPEFWDKIDYWKGKTWEQAFFDTLYDGFISASTPMLTNTGTDYGMSVSCSGSYVGDSIEEFYETRKQNALLTKEGFGTSVYLGDVRPRGSKMKNGEANGSQPVAEMFVDDAMKVSQGSARRGASSWYYPIDGGDFDELVHYLETFTDGNNAGWNLNDEFRDKLLSGDKDAVMRWGKMLSCKGNVGSGYQLFIDKVNRKVPQMYKDKGLKVKASNLCVAPETMILTKQGYQPIGELDGETVEVWNGKEWSETTVSKTGENQKLVKVTTNFNQEIDCTEYHKFYIQEGVLGRGGRIVEKRAFELKSGDKLVKFDLPVIEGEEVLENAYSNGFYSGDGTCYKGKQMTYLYHDKRSLLPYITDTHSVYNDENQKRIVITHKGNLKDKYFVPINNYTIESRLEWLAGLCDSDGTVSRNGSNESLQIGSIHLTFLQDIQLMLQTLGVTSTINVACEEGYKPLPLNDGSGNYGDFYCKKAYRLLINSNGLFQLSELGFKTNRLQWVKRRPNRECNRFMTIKSVEDLGRYDNTYCFNEPKRHMGMFNGILTGQCSEIVLYSDSDNTYTCVLASENLRKFDERPEMLAFVGTVMLDCVASDFIEKAKEKGNMQRALKFTEEHRALGYGVMAFHTYLLDHSIVWGSLESKFTNIKMFSTIKSEAMQATKWMANVLGEPEICKGYGVRNTHLLAVAPTKSTALIVGSVSEGINPQVGFVYTQSTPSGEVFRIDPSFLQLIKDKGIYTSEDDKATQDFLYDIISHKGSIQHREEFSEHEKAVYRTAFEINPYDHLDLVSERQEYICQAQSCNVFLANTTAKEMSKLYLYAYLDKNILSLYYHYGLRDANIQTNVVCESCGG